MTCIFRQCHLHDGVRLSPIVSPSTSPIEARGERIHAKERGTSSSRRAAAASSRVVAFLVRRESRRMESSRKGLLAR
jgi:hypothetical protein